MESKHKVVIGIVKRVALPVIVGSLVVFLMANGLDNWANIVCDISSNLGIYVSECK